MKEIGVLNSSLSVSKLIDSSTHIILCNSRGLLEVTREMTQYKYICTLYKWKFKGTACGYITHVLYRETFCACTAQRIAWRLQNRILVSVSDQITGNYIWQ